MSHSAILYVIVVFEVRNMKNESVGQEYVEFGTQLRRLRQARNLTQGQLSEIIGVSKTSIVNYETATRKVPLALIKKFSEYFQVSIDDLIGIQATPPLHPILHEHWCDFLCKHDLSDNEARQLCAVAEFMIHNRRKNQ